MMTQMLPLNMAPHGHSNPSHFYQDPFLKDGQLLVSILSVIKPNSQSSHVEPSTAPYVNHSGDLNFRGEYILVSGTFTTLSPEKSQSIALS